ncbi:DUF742 domain-containing protein [Amycolatopsis taiwanensis]|uniref:DUF742 domain-containing protein n=1 Tax=Amycolatopsis taiwanensis TaxID=342230 RepID=UPI00048500BD|nr:DUF742 domain-containing protein [Amycolatopsis taiwanensis]
MGIRAGTGPADEPVPARAGARFPASEPAEPQQPEASPAPHWPLDPAAAERPPPYGQPAGTDWSRHVENEEISGPRVRPYVLTRGRTHSSYELRLETLVSLRADAVWEGSALGAEYQPVRALCVAPRSVAEVAALLSVPLGVARVLLSDMADMALIHIHGTERTAEGRPPMALMRRVLDGLQRL